MADIELVIKIPEEAKQAFDCAESNDLKGSYYDFGGIIGNAIKNGIPLPEHHGDLKDAYIIQKHIMNDLRLGDEENGGDVYDVYYKEGLSDCYDFVKNAPTIIPATKPPHWIERRLQMGLHDWMCSVCKCQCEDTVKICPNCGVDTDGRYEMEEDDGGYWFQQREKQATTKEGKEVEIRRNGRLFKIREVAQ